MQDDVVYPRISVLESFDVWKKIIPGSLSFSS